MSLTPPAPPFSSPLPLTEVEQQCVDGAASKPSRLRRALRVVALLLLAGWSLLLLAWLALHWLILPHIERWREPMQARASAALGVPVRIGAIEVRSSGWVPSFELRDVVLLDAQQRPALRLPRVLASVSLRTLLSLLSLQLRFEQLLLDGPELDARRDAAGRISVAGLRLGGGNSGNDDGAATDWVFSQTEVVIRGGVLRWTDEQRRAEPLVLRDVQLVVRNSLRGHAVRIDATPPPEWGDRFSVSGRFTQPVLARRGDWQRWSGEAYASLPRADLQLLRQHVTLPFELSQGAGALRAWVTLAAGRPEAATVDLALRAVTLRLAKNIDPVAVEQVRARVVAQRRNDGVTLAVQRLGFVTADDDIRWPEGDLTLTLRQREGEPSTGGEFHADRLDLGQMAQIASRVPLGDALRKLLVQLEPKGVVSAVAVGWDGPLDAPLHYNARASASGLSLSAQPADDPRHLGRPGLRNASLQLDATDAGGTAQIGIQAGALELPGALEDPVLPLDEFAARLAWTIEPAPNAPSASGAVPGWAASAASAVPPRITVQARDVRFANADMKGELTASWRTGAGTGSKPSGSAVHDKTPGNGRGSRFPGWLELDGSLSEARVGRVFRYLPLAISKDPRAYVENALQSGKLSDAVIRVKGDLSDFPFYNARSNQDGEFRITARVDDAAFAFVPSRPASGSEPARVSPWPTLDKVGLDLELNRGTLLLRNGRAHIGALEFRGAQAALRNLETDAVLALDTGLQGPLAEMLSFVNTTPLGGWIGNVLAGATASGNADLKLGLGFPLAHPEAATVNGSLALNGNDLRITPDSPLLGAAKARVDFTQKGFALSGASAQVYGGSASFDGGLQPDGSVRFDSHGTATAEGLRQATELGAVSRVAASLDGRTDYRATLAFTQGHPEIDVTTDLVGIASRLPAPLAKPADSALALHYRTALDAGPSGAAAAPPTGADKPATTRDQLDFNLGSLVQAHYERESVADQTRVLRGGIGVLAPAPRPASGVAANLAFKSLEADAWQAAAARIFDAGEAHDTPAKGAPAAQLVIAASAAASGAAAANPASDDYAPTSIALRADELTGAGRRLTRVVAGLSKSAGLWRANLDAEQLSGYVEYRPPASGGAASAPATAAAPAGRIYARLARLSLPKSDVEQVESLLDQQPASLPALDVIVNDFDLRGISLGRVEIEATNRTMGQGREALRDWAMSKFNITTPEATLTATGHWSAVGAAARRATMDFKLALGDSGQLLDRLGTRGAVRGGKGEMTGQVGWLGSPFALDYPSLEGQIRIAIESGQFLKVEPGAARLLGVLSLQSLPRRLSLDFRDVFQEGFAFDNITGDLTIEKGVAETNNLRMRGVQAVVLMEGKADIGHETQDLRAVVVPEISASATLAYAVINPAIGLGAFLAQALLKKPLTEAGTREFQVSGPWADPKVERVEYRGTAEAASAPASAPAPSPPSTFTPATTDRPRE